MKKSQALLISLVFTILFVGCSYVSTNNVFFEETTRQVYSGNYSGAINSVIKAKEEVYKLKDRVMYYLDLGMLYHYNGQYELSNQTLTQAERAIEELYTKSVSKAALSMLLNDNAMDYGGEEYEDIYLNFFKALNYINLDKTEDAFVEIRRLNGKLDVLEDKYATLSSKMNSSKDAKIEVKSVKNKFYNSAMARYLSILLYRNSDDWDDVRIDKGKFDSAWETQPEVYNFAKPSLEASLDRDAEGRLNLFCFAGKSPEKRSRTWWIRTWNDYIFIGASKEQLSGDKVTNYFDMIYWKDVTSNLFFKFQIPVMQSRASEIEKIRVIVDGKQYKTALLESFDNVAESTFELKKNLIYLKTIIRTVSKGLLTKQGKDKIDQQVGNELMSSLLNLGADLAVSATEQADLRISHYFPKLAHIAEIHLPAGDHTLEVEYLNIYGNVVYNDNRGTVRIAGDKLNLVESFCLQ
ncbi:MAG: hypothetical protein K9M99_03870 [Candidatus Cloacimonetes bacterium]|nr:hypothetical protein [Candidatus Cloacimonadota bacterium]